MGDKYITPDARNRIALGKLAEGVSRFEITHNEDDDTITLRPMVDVPRKELWMWENKEKMAGIEKSFQQAESGNVKEIPAGLMTTPRRSRI